MTKRVRTGDIIETTAREWLYFQSIGDLPYEITDKYLFFSEDRDKLVAIARNEIRNHGFHHAKTNNALAPGSTEFALCHDPTVVPAGLSDAEQGEQVLGGLVRGVDVGGTGIVAHDRELAPVGPFRRAGAS